MLHLEAEVHADVLHAGVDVGVEVHVADGGGAFEGSSEARHLETRHQLDCAVLQLAAVHVSYHAAVCRPLPVHHDGPGPGDPAEPGEDALGEAHLDIDIVDTRYYR